ncbi:GNAT family N-acetyltransferase [Actinopolymorpha alba]|uniref:GNAT family N-acetyltransferase n=1 Tax=Actinopolymorpha alba TaxID=533267 RepID=UPI00035D01EB|nr:GNAT family N-acetyltransferase [Actinopolymorpha alba]
MAEVQIRSFAVGDGPGLAAAWTESAPGDPITYDRFRDLVLLDRNFDAEGLRVAEQHGRIVGAAYAVRRRIAAYGSDLEPQAGWIPFFFVSPAYQGNGLGRSLLTSAMGWLAEQGCEEVYFSSYTPNYFLPGLDVKRYPRARALLEGLGFGVQYAAVAMDRSLVDYEMPADVRARISELRTAGYRFGAPSGDDLVELVDMAGSVFNPDWARAIREAVVAGLPLARMVVAHDPSGSLLGWAMHGTYEGVPERFGPFGVVPEARGTGLGKVLLHLTLEQMRAIGAHSAWFLWTSEKSAAGQLYLKTGFTITRTFTILRARLARANEEGNR